MAPAAKPKRHSQHSAEEIRRMSLVFKHSTDVFVLTDTEGLLTWASPAFSEMTGYALDEVLGKKPGAVLQGPGTDPETVATLSRNIKDRTPVRVEILNYTKSEQPYWVELNVLPIFDEDGLHTNYMSVERDITERKALEADADRQRGVEEARRRERRLLGEISEWLYACQSVEELLKVISAGMEQLIPEADGCLYLYSNSRDILEGACDWNGARMQRAIDLEDCWSLRRGRAYTFGASNLNFPCAHGNQHPEYPYLCLPMMAHGDTIGLIHLNFKGMALEEAKAGPTRDLIENRRDLALIYAEQISLALANVRLRDELHDQSIRDQLTGLFNRRWFLEHCRREIVHAKRDNTPLSLISADVDHFKLFNDNYGHDAGDMVLRQVGQVLSDATNGVATACRLGGEEFAVLAPGLDESDAIGLAERIRLGISELRVKYAGGDLPRVTLSAGIATLEDGADDVQDLMKSADEALYAAKRKGRDCVLPVSAHLSPPATALSHSPSIAIQWSARSGRS